MKMDKMETDAKGNKSSAGSGEVEVPAAGGNVSEIWREAGHWWPTCMLISAPACTLCDACCS